MKKANRIVGGVVLIALGVLLALRALNLLSFEIFFDGWWTLFIILPSLSGLVTERDKTGNLIGLCVGVLLLLWRRGLFDIDLFWKILGPLVIVILGVRLILGGMRKGDTEKRFDELRKKGGAQRTGCAVFGGSELRFDGEPFEGAELTAVFGGVDCDLRNAHLEGDIPIKVCAVFGGIDILVPEGVTVKMDTFCLFGGASDEKHRHGDEKATVYVSGFCLFGGVEIK